jgi:hypothetical protein
MTVAVLSFDSHWWKIVDEQGTYYVDNVTAADNTVDEPNASS